MFVRRINCRVFLNMSLLAIVLTAIVTCLTMLLIQTNSKCDRVLKMEENIKDRLVTLGVPEISKDTTKKAILLSYMRSGTTFVGSMFEKNADIFYLFEPEWPLFFYSLNEYSPLKYLDGTVRDHIWIDDARNVVKEIMRNYLTCNISGINLKSLKSTFHAMGQYTRPLYNCVRKPNANLTECVAKVARVCEGKEIRFAKTVRLRMEEAEDLLRSDPNLRVIHMIRDPRGIAVSRIGWNEFYAAKTSFTIGTVCAEILRDIETVEKMDRELRTRVLPILYEDTAEHPEEILQSLYSFLNISLPEIVKSFIRNVTRAKADDRIGFKVQRANSAKTAHSWRSKIDWNLCRDIDQICERVYTKIGLVSASNEKELRNHSVLLRKSERSDSYMYTYRPVN